MMIRGGSLIALHGLRFGRAAAAIALTLVFSGFLYTAGAIADDKADLLTAAREYFDAEMKGDHEQVWNLLAPSSVFRRSYSYPMYLEMVRGNSVHLKRYVLEEVLDITDNPDPGRMPTVEKIGLIRVTVFLAVQGEKDAERRSVLTFLKEGGKWYKG